MKEECLICGAPLEYLETDVQMQCEICRKKELTKTRCVNGHYVCSDCHMQGLDSIVELCLRETACDPVAIVERMMALPSCHMHGPEHHVMVGAALLTAYHNAGGDIALSDALMEMLRRGIDTTLETSEEELRAAKHLRYTGEMQDCTKQHLGMPPTTMIKTGRPLIYSLPTGETTV